MSSMPNDDNAILREIQAKRLAELEGFEHLLFEPMTQADLDQLYALSERWTEQLGDSPEGIKGAGFELISKPLFDSLTPGKDAQNPFQPRSRSFGAGFFTRTVVVKK